MEPRKTLREALAAFTAPEKLDGANRWKSGKCSREVRATKQLAVEKAPEVCVVHLKRFEKQRGGKREKQRGGKRGYGNKNAGSQKLTSHVAFTERLDLAREQTPSSGEIHVDASNVFQASTASKVIF